MDALQDFDTGSVLIKTLVLYSVAEAQGGHASRIRVSVDGRRFVVADNGRGHSMSRAVDGVPYVRLIYGQLDYPFTLSPGPTVQLQGLASSLVQALCACLVVTVRRDGVAHRVSIKQGQVTQTSNPVAPGEESGNTIEGSIRPEFPFALDSGALQVWLREVDASVPGLSISFNGTVVTASALSGRDDG